MQADIIRDAVQKTYGEIVKGQVSGGCCNSGASSSCCGPTPSSSRALGYSDEDLANVPEGADLGLGCGNPQAIVALRPGERVLDLGSGAGFVDVRIDVKGDSRELVSGWVPGRSAEDYVASALIEAVKP